MSDSKLPPSPAQPQSTHPTNIINRLASAPASFWRSLGGRFPKGSGFDSSRTLAKWLVIGSAIGIVAGLGAVVFSWAIAAATELFLGRLAGYVPPQPFGEGNIGLSDIGRPWALPFVVALGGLLSGLIVFKLAPEAEGHGTDAVINAIHHKRGLIRGRVAPVKIVASAVTIGSGGSAGREGPTAQISAGFGSMLSSWLDLNASDRRTAVAAGMGAGIAAIFRAPLGGAVMASEILYIHDLEVEVLIPSLIASIVSYSVFGLFEGWDPIFGAQPGLAFERPLTLVYYVLLGVICGLGGLLYSRTFYGTTAFFHRLNLPRWLKPALGGLLVGLIGLKVQGALGTGYGFTQIEMSTALRDFPLWLVLALPFAKILATSLSIGSGGSGGIFGPGMVIGGAFGAAFWRLGEGVLPQMPSTPAPFVIVGMIALFGGIAHAPLAMLLMVGEMTGNLNLLAPAMIAVAISTALVGNETIYRNQLPNRAAAPAHRIRFSFPLLSSLMVRDAMIKLPSTTPPPPQPGDIELFPDQPLDTALEQLTDDKVERGLVREGDAIVGQLNARDVVLAYKKALGRSVRRAGTIAPNAHLIEAVVTEESPIAGRRLRDIRFPHNALVVTITRDGEAVFPKAETEIEVADHLLILADPADEEAIRISIEADQADASDQVQKG